MDKSFVIWRIHDFELFLVTRYLLALVHPCLVHLAPW